MVKPTLVLVFVAACGTFEDPAVVLDLRPLAISADVPEQVVSVDLTMPLRPDQVLVQLVDAHVSVLIADRNFDRGVRWTAELCDLTDALRCDHDGLYFELGSGVWPDPDTSPVPQITIPADDNLLGVLLDELQHDTLHGLGGLTYGVSLRLGGEDADPALDQYAAKALMVSPAIPADRTPNHNPTLDHIDATVGGDNGTTVVSLPLAQAPGVCGFTPASLILPPATKLRLEPIELPDTRETYTVPTIDGMTRTFTEAVTYQWLATGGKFADASTGGGHDTFGNLMPVHTTWTTPEMKDLDPSGNVQMWIIQRDERLGVSWYEACFHIEP